MRYAKNLVDAIVPKSPLPPPPKTQKLEEKEESHHNNNNFAQKKNNNNDRQREDGLGRMAQQKMMMPEKQQNSSKNDAERFCREVTFLGKAGGVVDTKFDGFKNFLQNFGDESQFCGNLVILISTSKF